MKLRNKKIGVVIEANWIAIYNPSFDLYDKHNKKLISDVQTIPTMYESLSELNENWEDYTPQEPLIKDEKIRKAVKAWAKVNDIRFGRRCAPVNGYSKRIVGWNAVGITFTIEFDKDLKMYGDKITKDVYTITELCGEEE